MHSDTLEAYKKAIKIKYEIEKDGEYFDYLYSPSRGKLRDLCWLIFENNPTHDDLNVFRNLFCLDYDYTKKNRFKEQKDKFRPIETFFKGETDPLNIDAINLAAVMVDFQPRPFKRFNEKCRIEELRQIECVDKIAASLVSEKEVVEIESLMEIENEAIEIESLVENENEESKEDPKKGNLFLNFAAIFSKKIGQKIYPRKIITIAIGTVALVSSACLYLVKRKN